MSTYVNTYVKEEVFTTGSARAADFATCVLLLVVWNFVASLESHFSTS